MKKFNVVLASASPRRKELLGLIFDEFLVFPSSVDETIPENLEAVEVPEFLSKIKARDVADKFPDSLVIGADTCVIINNEILGKPSNFSEAKRMLKTLSGNTHSVITGCTIIYKGVEVSFSVETFVNFYELNEQQIVDYINLNESYDKAGGYGIQSKGAMLLKSINGDYFNVVGLPVAELNRKILDIIKIAG